MAKKVNTGNFTVYNIFRDHLGTITHLRNSSTGQVDEFSFDAWGRRRDKDNWGYTVSGDPVLFADRGFTAHEFLPDFNLYNMNGRLYDPVVGRFLSPDPYISDPSFSQSYNRYSYCLNNPLKYIDPTGLTWWSDFWDWAGKGLNNLGNWMAKNNIYFYGGVNMSGSGTMPFVGIAGPNNFNVNSQSFVKQPAAPVQRINSQIAGFKNLNNNDFPEISLPVQQFVGPTIEYNMGQSNWGGLISTLSTMEDIGSIPLDAYAMRVSGNLGSGYYVNSKGVLSPYSSLKNYNPDINLSKQGNLSRAFTNYRALGRTLTTLSHGVVLVGAFLDFGEYYTGRINGAELQFKYSATAIGFMGGPIGLGISAYLTLGPPPTDPRKLPNAVKEEWGWMYVCFRGSTLVHSESGFRKIRDLKTGEKVFSMNTETDSLEINRIIEVFKHTTDEIYKVRIDNDMVYVTGEHPFYVTNKGWGKVRDLQPGDRVKNLKGNSGQIRKINKLDRELPVFNIRVEGSHNYFISRNCYLVHNK